MKTSIRHLHTFNAIKHGLGDEKNCVRRSANAHVFLTITATGKVKMKVKVKLQFQFKALVSMTTVYKYEGNTASVKRT